jgi:predicted PurR-regulated permease PerM
VSRRGSTDPDEADDQHSVPPEDLLVPEVGLLLEEEPLPDRPPVVRAPPLPLTTRTAFRIGFLATLGAMFAYGLVHAVLLTKSVLVLLLVSAFLAIGLNPLVELLQKRAHLTRPRAVATVLAMVLLAFAVFLVAIVPPIVDQTTQLVDKGPSYLDQLLRNRTIKRIDEQSHVIAKAKTALQSPALAANVFGGVLGVGKAVFGAVFSTVTVLTLTLYFMSSLPAMKRAAYRAVPRSRRETVAYLADDILERIGGYVAGALGIALIAGTTTCLLLIVLGVPSPVALALVVMVTDLVPVIGATIGAVVVSSVAFAHDVQTGIVVALFYLVYQQFENYVLYPRIMKRSVDVSPAVTIVAVLLGGSLMGILGALLAIPTAAAVQLVMLEVVLPHQEAS